LTENKLLLATTNQGKAREIKRFLEGLDLQIESLADYPELGACQETGQSFEENSQAKSLFYGQNYSGLVLAEDSGLEVDCLGGQPGIHSARFAGPEATDEQNIRKLLSCLKGVSLEKRKAKFVCVVSIAHKGKIIKTFRGQVRGIILEEPRGENGFGYDPVFYYPQAKKTFAQLKTSEKNRVSHRARALRKLRKFLFSYCKKSQ
jgi:XTP/dITP diphosphohydrolase